MFRIALLLPLLLFSACRGSNPGKHTDATEAMATHAMNAFLLKTYEVPKGMGRQVVDVLNHNLSALPQAAGRADLLPNGHVALLALPSIHGGMAELIENMKNAAPAEQVNAHLNIWFVLARPSEKAVALKDQAIQSVVAQALPGTQEVHLVEKLHVQAAAGARAEAGGSFFELGYSLQPKPDRMMAHLQVKSIFGTTSLETRIFLETGKTVVLSESALRLPRSTAGDLNLEEGLYTLLMVMRTENVD